jgi:hypothetical protein
LLYAALPLPTKIWQQLLADERGGVGHSCFLRAMIKFG